MRALQLDPRVPFSRVGEVLGVSEQTVARRYRRLRREGLLRVTGVVDPRALGLTDWMIRLRCRPDGAGSVAEALARRKDVSWVMINSGGSEVLFALRSRTEADREDLLVRRLPKSAPVIDIAAAMILHRYIGNDPADSRGLSELLTPGQSEQLAATPPAAVPSLARLDAVDHVLLDLLARDGRGSYAALARAVGRPAGQVVRRVAALRSSGVVYFYLDLAGVAMGNPTSATLWLSARPADLDAVGRALARYDEVPFAAAISGRSNLVAIINCADAYGLHEFVTSKLAQIGAVTEYELSPVLRRVKQAGALIKGDRLADPPPTRLSSS